MMPLPDPYTAISWLIELCKYVTSYSKKIMDTKKDDFLNYDPSYLITRYVNESPIGIGIPYTELCNWFDNLLFTKSDIDKYISLNVFKSAFRLDQSQYLWSEICDEAFFELKKSGRVKENEPAIRLSNFKKEQNNVHMSIQKAHYFDQAKSNLILEWKSKNNTTLNNYLNHEYGNSLPPIEDKKLANTIGIASLLFYINKGKWVPYFVKRVKKVAVFPGVIQCTASGVAKWPSKNNNPSFYNFFIDHMYYEFEEEVGLKKNDILELVPIAFCREFARGGKPQLFFVGITHLSRVELFEKRKMATKIISATNGWKEIEKDSIFNSADFIITQSNLLKSIKKNKLSHEARATLHYGELYIKNNNQRLLKLITKRNKNLLDS